MKILMENYGLDENFQMMGVKKRKIPILEEWKYVQYIAYDMIWI